MVIRLRLTSLVMAVTAAVFAIHTPSASGASILFVVENPASLTGDEAARQSLMETWGYTVTLIDSADSQANFDAATATVDVAYIPAEISDGDLGTKLTSATIGIVNESFAMANNLGFKSGAFDTFDNSTIDVVDPGHHITSSFGTGVLTICMSSQPLMKATGSVGDARILAEADSATAPPALLTLGPGDSLEGVGGTAAGRRASLPWGGTGFAFSSLTVDAQTLMRRAIEWGEGQGGTGAAYYVRTIGSDGNAGTSAATAWATIGKAAATMIAGDTVYIGAGTYDESVLPGNDGTAGNPIRYIGDVSGEMTGDAGDVIVTKTGSVVFNLKDGAYIHLLDLHIKGGTMNVDMEAHDGGRLERCTVYDSTSGHGIHLKKPSNIVVVNCLVYGNALSGIYGEAPVTETVISHCTVTGNWSHGIYVKKESISVTNCIFSSNSGFGLYRADGTLTHTYNLVWDNSSGDYSGTSASTGEISLDPLFVSASDYRLQSSSPAIDVGTDQSSVTMDDLEGTARPEGGGWDMGCFERVSAALRITSWREVDPNAP